MSETPKNRKGGPVFGYLAIMFAAAFLMLLLAYFIQQRNNEVALDGLRDSITSFESMDELLADNRQLREKLDTQEQELDALEAENSALQEELDICRSQYSQLEENYRDMGRQYDAEQDRVTSWELFWNIEQLYQAGHYSECAEAIRSLMGAVAYATPEDAQSRADEIWSGLTEMGLLTEEDAEAHFFRSVE